MHTPRPPVDKAAAEKEYAQFTDEWSKVEKEFEALEVEFKAHQAQSNNVREQQEKITKKIAAIQKQAKAHRADIIRKVDTFGEARVKESMQKVLGMDKMLAARRNEFPRDAKFLLRCYLGHIDLAIPNESNRFKYKQQYEEFKLWMTYVIIGASALVLWSAGRYRSLEKVFHFVLVNYYFAVILREHILVQNGSKIKTWWRVYNYCAIVLSGVMLTWPKSMSFTTFHPQFMVFSLYIGLVQLLQYQYQKKASYIAVAVNGQNSLNVSHSAPKSKLTYIVVCLFVAYIAQLYNAYTLLNLYMTDSCREWQVAVCGLLFFGLGLGNIVTMVYVIHGKTQPKVADKDG